MWTNVLMKFSVFLIEIGMQLFIEEADKDKNGTVSAEEAYNFIVEITDKIYNKVKNK